MELKEFTKQTLLQIIEGVKEAQVDGLNLGAIINPINIISQDNNINFITLNDNNTVVNNVNFEVEVSTIDETNKDKGAGIFVGHFKLGANVNDIDKTSALNKISFVVPVALPTIDYNENNTPPQFHFGGNKMEHGW